SINVYHNEVKENNTFYAYAYDFPNYIGSFGPLEDQFFYKATELARSLGIPRVYLVANSGARIGLAEE
ncbi:5019_t:CDS:1, partial [Funneliformis geosporum]